MIYFNLIILLPFSNDNPQYWQHKALELYCYKRTELPNNNPLQGKYSATTEMTASAYIY